MSRELARLDAEPSLPSSSIIEWLRQASSWPVARRATRFAIVVGAVLIAINHGDAIVRGEIGAGRVLQMGLTLLVPYVVSTLSSVLAIRELGRGDPPPPAE